MATQIFRDWQFPVTGGASPGRTMPVRLSDVICVKDWGAMGNNSNDDTAEIQAAVDYCISQGGGIVYFPSGFYRVTAPIQVGSNNVGDVDKKIQLIGADKGTALISPTSGFADGSSIGYLISKGTKTYDLIERVEGLRLTSANSGIPTFGNLKITGTAVIVQNVQMTISGGVALDAADTQGAIIRSCVVNGANNGAATTTPGPTVGSKGICLGSGSVCTGSQVIGGVDISYTICGTGAAIIGCRTETCNTVCRVGWKPSGASSATGCTIQNFQTERCVVGIDLYDATGCTVIGNNITNQAASPSPEGSITNMTYSAGVVTVTTGTHNLPIGAGKKIVIALGGNPTWAPDLSAGQIAAGYSNFDLGMITANVTDSTHFTYPGPAATPSAFSVNAGTYWNYGALYGMRFRKVTDCVVMGNQNNMNVINTSWDLTYAGTAQDWVSLPSGGADHSNNVITGNSSNMGFFMPAANNRASWKISHTTTRQNFYLDDAANYGTTMVFANLPGQAGVKQAGPYEGQEYDITDGSTATFNATVSGGGSNHVKVRYDGTNWKVSG